MELFRERVCGIDIGKADVKACVRVPGKGTRRVEVTRTAHRHLSILALPPTRVRPARG